MRVIVKKSKAAAKPLISTCIERESSTIIGIDGGTHTGVAIFSRDEQKFTSIVTLDFWKTHDLITGTFDPSDTLIIIEDPSSQSAVFHRDHRRAYQNKIAQRVGAVKRESILLADGIERKGFTVLRVPISKQRKWSEGYFRRITKYEGRTSQHGRDSARLVLQYANTNRSRASRKALQAET